MWLQFHEFVAHFVENEAQIARSWNDQRACRRPAFLFLISLSAHTDAKPQCFGFLSDAAGIAYCHRIAAGASWTRPSRQAASRRPGRRRVGLAPVPRPPIQFHRRPLAHCCSIVACNWFQRHSIGRKARPRVRLIPCYFLLPSFNYADVFVLMIKIHLSILFFPLQMQVMSSTKQYTKYDSGYQKCRKKQWIHELIIESQKGAMERFYFKECP